MENHDALRTATQELARQIEVGSLQEIDFDLMGQTLAEIGSLIDRLDVAQQQLGLLRADYVARVSGMIKATAAVSRRQAALTEAAAVIETLAQLSSEQLIDRYRQAAASFRQAFPASFGLVRPSRSQKDLNDYK